MIQEIIDNHAPGELITEEVINLAFGKIAEQRNDHYFEHYAKRLRRVFGEEKLPFVKKLLNQICLKDQITMEEVQDLAYSLVSPEQMRRAVGSLAADGYIVKTSGSEIAYKFNSSILKGWWNNHEA